MTDTIRDIMTQLDAFVDSATKQANATEGIDSLPGSENDKPIPSGATEPDPKVKDETIDNGEHKSTEGAKPDGDIPASNANKLEANEAAVTPDTKPLDTADANAKEAAAKKANDIVATILKAKQAEKAAAQAKPAAPAAPATPAAPAAPATKQAAPDAGTITLDMAMLAKIAAITLADEEGQMAVQAALTKRAGAEFANEILDVLEKRAAAEQARYEFEKGAQDAEAMIGDLQEAQGAADAEQALADAGAAAGDEAAAAGAAGDDAGAMEDAATALDDYSADEIVEAVQELAQEGQIPEDQAQAVIESVTQAAQGEGDPGEVSEEDVAEALTEAVESGELTEEDAQALVQAIAEGGGDAEADQQLAADVAGAGAASEGEAAANAEAADAAQKEAAEKKAAAEKRAAFKDQLIAVLKGKK